MAAAKRVLRYLCSTSGMGLVLGGRSPVVLTGHADASWADDQATQRLSQGYTFGLGSGSVSWRATRSSSVLGSSCEAEIYASSLSNINVATMEVGACSSFNTVHAFGPQSTSGSSSRRGSSASLLVRKSEFKLVKAAEDEGVEAEEQQQFQSLVGSLLYAAVHTRPDISFSVGQLARVVQNPSEEQVDAAERVVKYLNPHPSIGVQYSASAQVKQKGVEVLKEKGERLREGKLFLTCFTDATWASEKDDSSSVGGYICVVGGGFVSWRSKKQTETALSSIESEYMAMFHGVKEVIWLRRLLEEIGQEQKVATPLFCDSKGALGMAMNAVLHGLNKHIRIKWHWLRKEDGGARRNQKNMVADSSDNNPKSNGGAERKKERTAGQFFHIGEQGEQGDASAKVGAELHPLDYWVLDTGAAWTMAPRNELLDDV
ncbi:unnamed protein product [Closterium sp. NIES-54]